MKKLFNLALFGAIALTGAVGFSSCSSSSDEVIDNPDYDPTEKVVKTEFTISLPGNVRSATRMSSSEVPDNNVFRGMENIALIPFADAGAIISSSVRLGSNITLPGTTAADNNSIPTTGLNANNNSKVFNNVTIPVGTSSFLLYAKAIDGTLGASITADADYHKYGYLTPSDLTAEPASFTFTPKQIYSTSGTPEKATNIVAYLNAIANAKYTVGTTDYLWSASTNTGLQNLYNQFIDNKAGSSNSVKLLVADLYNSLYKNTDAMSKAIVTAIKTKCTVPATEDGTITSWDETIDGYPGNIYLPDGAAAVSFTSGTGFSVANGTIYNTSSLTDYVYPANLYYYVNSQIKTDTNSKATEYTSTANTTWASVLAKYTNDNASVQPDTRSVAIKNTIQYAVGRFDMTVKLAATTLYDYKGEAIDATNGFTVTGVLIGNQQQAKFDFTPKGTSTGTSIVYDNAITAATKATTTASTANRTLVLETLPNSDVKVVVEFTNDIADFYGKDGQLIKKDSKFYMLATLAASSATETESKVFKQDYNTTANFAVKVGTANTAFDTTTTKNEEGLGAAYNVIPDLRTPALELGMSVDLQWSTGHTYENVYFGQ